MFYKRPSAYTEVMRSAIALNGSFFNAQRMVQQYVANVYRLPSGEHELDPAGSR
jgi:starch phosphorylase